MIFCCMVCHKHDFNCSVIGVHAHKIKSLKTTLNYKNNQRKDIRTSANKIFLSEFAKNRRKLCLAYRDTISKIFLQYLSWLPSYYKI